MDVKSARSRLADGAAPENASAAKRKAGAGNEVSEKDAKRMSQALNAGEKSKGDGESGPGDLTALFSQAMGNLAGQPVGVITERPSMAAPPSPIAETASAHCGELVDRILVSTPSADGSAEVRIRIDKPWLPDTEVRIALSPDARLEVEFHADSPDAQRFLLPNLDGLRERLAERRDGGVTVRMTENFSESGGEGRSRNRRNVIEEYDGE